MDRGDVEGRDGDEPARVPSGAGVCDGAAVRAVLRHVRRVRRGAVVHRAAVRRRGRQAQRRRPRGQGHQLRRRLQQNQLLSQALMSSVLGHAEF